MRQVGVSEPPKIVGVRLAWDEVPDDASGGGTSIAARGAPTPAGGGTQIAARGAPTPAATAPTPLVSRQPAPGPLAAGVADRYAKALTLDPAPVAPPPPPAPRRSRAAMRDRALRPNTRANNRRPERARSRPGTAALREPWTPAPALDAESDPAPDRERRSNASARSSSSPTTHDPQSRRAAVAPPAGAPGSASLSRRRGASARPTASVRDDPVGGIAGRRTVTIRGRGAEPDLGWSPYHSRRRPPVPAHERSGFRPDRAAMWAVFLGLLLVLVAATSSHAAVLTHVFH
jgi:hypothetical protein